MNDYKKDFENAIRMIDWQNEIITKQQEKMTDLQTTISFLQEECMQLRGQINDLLH